MNSNVVIIVEKDQTPSSATSLAAVWRRDLDSAEDNQNLIVLEKYLRRILSTGYKVTKWTEVVKPSRGITLIGE